MSKRSLVACAALAALAAVAPRAHAGGGPMNVLVLYDADDAEATSVAGYYATARSLPPGHPPSTRPTRRASCGSISTRPEPAWASR